MVIYKYSAPISHTIFEIEMEEDIQILSVQVQDYSQEPQIWALIDLKKKKVKRLFKWLATGEVFAAELKNYIGTIQLLDGRLVYHLFELQIKS